MSILLSILNALFSWRRSRRSPTSKRAKVVALEQLDHRQLLSVNFTGNVYNDFPATSGPGVAVVLNPTLPSSHPGFTIPSDIKPFIEHSGFDIDGYRLEYTPADDTLSVGIQQPINSTGPVPPGVNPAIAGNPVIAGDADDNGNAGTVNPNVQALRPTFSEFPSLGGSDRMGVFFDFNNTGTPDVVAGIPRLVELTGQTENKLFQVAQAVNFPGVSAPSFGTPLQDFTGYATLINTPAAGAFEFKISHFSELYQAETGKPLTATTTFGVGAFGGSDNDIGIGEAFFPSQPVTLGLGPIPPKVCPPASPPVLINPHENRHINTAHPTLIRVNVFGSSGFDVTKIVPSTVRLGGAAPVESFTRHINHDEFLDATFVFLGTDVHLPPGIIEAEVTGTLTDGTTFASSSQVFNRDKSFYTTAQIDQQAQRQAAHESQAVQSQGLASVAPTPVVSPAHEIRVTVPIPGKSAATQQQGLRSATQRQSPAVTPVIGLRRAHQAALASADIMA